jgi:transcriptional regulator with XRE-family HTH domain
MRKDREKIAKAFGNALQQERKRAGLSQEELAFRAKVDRTFVSRAESGKRQPALTTVFLLAKALGIRPAGLIEHTHKQLSN